MSQYIVNMWYSRPSTLAYLLWPFSIVFRVICAVRRGLYALKVFSRAQATVPVIVVGNLTVGGTGKTPLVIALVEHLQKNGYRPGIISRGYGGNYQRATWVKPTSDAHQVGDEALLLARRTQVPLVVARKRAQALQHLLADSDCNIVISDDGLQHYALPRDIEIAVVDGVRRFGNGFCLPAGPLREPRKRLRQVDLVVCNGKAQGQEYSMRLAPGALINLHQPEQRKPLAGLMGQVHAYAAIGHPQRFFDSLEHQGLQVEPYAFADHHVFKADDFAEGTVVMTEKDAVKCLHFAKQDWWYLPVHAELPAEFYQALDACLKLAAKPCQQA